MISLSVRVSDVPAFELFLPLLSFANYFVVDHFIMFFFCYKKVL